MAFRSTSSGGNPGSAVRLVVACAAALVPAAGCEPLPAAAPAPRDEGGTPPWWPSVDAGPAVPAALDLGADGDGDGLCEGTERRLGLDPRRADTDADGLPDGVEEALGTSARHAWSPPPAAVMAHPLDGAAGATWRWEVEVVGQGLDLEARAVIGAGPLDAVARPIDAAPAEAVAAIDADAARFVGVRGRVRLGVEVALRPRGVPPTCRVVAPLAVRLEGPDGRPAAAEDRWVVVTPPGAATWCAAAPPCL